MWDLCVRGTGRGVLLFEHFGAPLSMPLNRCTHLYKISSLKNGSIWGRSYTVTRPSPITALNEILEAQQCTAYSRKRIRIDLPSGCAVCSRWNRVKVQVNSWGRKKAEGRREQRPHALPHYVNQVGSTDRWLRKEGSKEGSDWLIQNTTLVPAIITKDLQ